MLNTKIIEFIKSNNIKHEIVQYSSTCSDVQLEEMINTSTTELANAAVFKIDGWKYGCAFISANYDVNQNHLKEALKVKYVDIITDANIEVAHLNSVLTNIWIDQDLATVVEEVFFLIDVKQRILLKIKSSILIESFDANIVNFKLSSKYRAKINFLSPQSNRENFEEHESCFFGVSLENSNFVRPKLMASLDWISRRFPSCLVLIGDSIHRITLEATQGLDPIEAHDKALFLGSIFLARERNIFKKFEHLCNFNFVFCSEVQSYPDYQIYYTKLQELFEQDISFQASVKAFGENYHRKRRPQLSEKQWEYHIDKSSQYFLEEFAIFACLKRRNIPVFVYPGYFSTLTEIVDGKYPNALRELKELTVVSLHFRKRSKRN